MMKVIMLSLFVSFLSGCSMLHQLDDYAGTNSANMSIENIDSGAVRIYPNQTGSCINTDVSNAGLVTTAGIAGMKMGSNKDIGMPKNESTPPKYREYKIDASQPIAIMITFEAERYLADNSRKIISSGMVFTPKPNANYQVTTRVPGYNSSLRIFELERSADGKYISNPVKFTQQVPCKTGIF